MEIRVFGMTLRLEVIIIAILLGMVLGGHLLCSCAKVPISEAFSETAEGGVVNDVTSGAAGADADAAAMAGAAAPTPDPANAVDIASVLGMVSNVGEVPGPVPAPPKKAATATNQHAEPFSDYSQYRDGENNSDVAGSWISKAGKYSSDLGYQPTSCKSNTYVGTAVPLPDGELFFFQNNQFKPECCPGPYSSSTGCACMSTEQINYLNTRGGNRTSDSEF
jgi:hypothetical protein